MIPVISLERVLAGDDPMPTARALGEVCNEVGFLQIEDHGVPLEKIDTVHRRVRGVMALPDEEKRKLEHPEKHPYRGWMRVSSPDTTEYFERYEMCVIDSPEDARAKGVSEERSDYFARNVWPDDPTFQDDLRALASELSTFAGRLLSLLAIDLGIEADHFAPLFVPESSALSTTKYGMDGERGKDGLLFFRHTDYQAVTVLHQRGDYDGLQIVTRVGELETVPRRDDALVVNLGDMMERWTNGRYRATPHQVIPPPEQGAERMSIAYFYSPAVDAEIRPVDAMVEDGAERMGAVNTYELGQALSAYKVKARSNEASG